jgi:hypothetical protein
MGKSNAPESATVERSDGWEEVVSGCAFATLEGSLYVFKSGEAVIFGEGVAGRRAKIRLRFPPGVKVIVDPNTRKERGVLVEKEEVRIAEKIDELRDEILNLEKRLNNHIDQERKSIEFLKRKIAQFEGD